VKMVKQFSRTGEMSLPCLLQGELRWTSTIQGISFLPAAFRFQ
jgi:hypothetical protein